MEEDFDLTDKEEQEDELFEHFRFVADKGQNPLRIDKYLYHKLFNTSRNKIQAAANSGAIKVNGISVKSNYKVRPDDIISIVLEYPKEEFDIVPEDIPLNIVHEDDDIIVVNKPPNMVVHPAYGNRTGTLINALAFHLKNNSMFHTQDHRPGMVHRIDKNTSGLLVIAKNEEAKVHLSKQFYHKTTHRKYQALIWGRPPEDKGTITGHIGRSLRDRKVMQVFPDGSQGKHAITHYRLLEDLGYVSLVECILETGRTHQIRAHFNYIKHPIFGDYEYNGDQILRGTVFSKYKQFVKNLFQILPRQALHAKELGFIHPGTGKEVFYNSELPKDMEKVIHRWRTYMENRPQE